MNISHLREFLVLSETLNYTKAAQKLYMSQPALSKHIESLEREFGIKLIDRNTSTAKLTPIGEAVVEDIAKVVDSHDAMLEKVECLRAQKQARISVLTYDLYQLVEDVLRIAKLRHRESHPLHAIDIAKGFSVSPIEEVRKGSYDICITGHSSEYDMTGLSEELIYHEPLVAVVRKSHPLAAKGSLRPGDLSGENIWMPTAASFKECYLEVKEILTSNGCRALFKPLRQKTSHDLFMLGFSDGVFVTGAGAALNGIPNMLLKDYAIVPFEDDELRTHGFAIYRENDANDAAKQFVETLVEVAGEFDFDCYWTLDAKL